MVRSTSRTCLTAASRNSTVYFRCAVFNAPEPRPSARWLFTEAIAQWRIEAPQLADWAEANRPDGFAVFDYQPARRVRLRTTSGLERINREPKRRMACPRCFPTRPLARTRPC